MISSTLWRSRSLLTLAVIASLVFIGTPTHVPTHAQESQKPSPTRGTAPNVPAGMKAHMTVTALGDGQLASDWMSKIGAKTAVYRVRKKLTRSASEYAEIHLAKHADEIEDAFKTMTKEQSEHAYNRWKWEIQREYFERVERGTQAKLAEAGLGRVEREQAETLLEAAKVKPVAGQLPRNHKYAGGAVPAADLPAAYRAKGLRFTEDGFPDFGSYAQTLPNGQKSVQIQLTGNYRRDVRLANKVAGFDPPETPANMAWHHHQNGSTMQLVPKDLHGEIRHTGGRGYYIHATGNPNAYK